MKKIQGFILCIVLTIVLLGCGNIKIEETNEIEHTFVEETKNEKIKNSEKLEENSDEVQEDILKYEELNLTIQGKIIVRGLTFYPPLTCLQAESKNIDYDGICTVNDIDFITFDWIEGDDQMDEEKEDSEMTVDSYAEVMDLRVACAEELNVLMENEPLLYLEYSFGWPTVYWTGENWYDEESGEKNPLLYNMAEFENGEPLAADFLQFNFPVILVSGELYSPDYTGCMEIREKEISEDGRGYFINMLWDVHKENEELLTIYVNENTKVYDENGKEVGLEELYTSQNGIEIIMSDTGDYADKIYIITFSMK